MPITVEISERLLDYWVDDEGQRRPKYHAQIKNESGYWACGCSPQEAIGDLIMSHPERFDVTIANIGEAAR